MEMEIKQIKRLYKTYARLNIKTDDGKYEYIDFEENELKELKEQINQYFNFNEVV